MAEDLIDSSEREDEEVGVPMRYMITSYGADFPIDSLVSRLNRGDIVLPDSQRKFVWSWPQSSRFIESLLLGLPVPGIFLYRQTATQRLVVVDGNQRIRALSSYYSGKIRGNQFSLKGVDQSLEGFTYDMLDDESRRVLDNSILHATIFQQDEPTGDKSSIYKVFERLNTSGTPLSSQEIRACVYRGSFIELLRELNHSEPWRSIYGAVSDRAKDEELILRIIAFNENWKEYSRPLKQFLNDFMETYSDAGEEWLEKSRSSFIATARIVDKFVTREALCHGNRLNASITDAMLVGLMNRLSQGAIESPDCLRGVALQLRNSTEFHAMTDRTTTDVSSVHGRIKQAISAFSGVP